MEIFKATVVGTRQLTPGMLRITLGGPCMAGFTSTGVGDEYVRVFLPAPGRREPVLPVPAGDTWEYLPGDVPSPMRTYTVRGTDPDRGTADIDFVVHDGGVAAGWAMQAKPGDVVGLNSPTGLYDPPAGIEWQVLVADATGLPAVARLVEQAPPGVRTRVLIEVPDRSHRQELTAGPHVDIAWVFGGNGHTQSRLDELIRAIDLPSGTGYVWFAGETKV
ncbi:MAG: siderophore interacting protein, partial [Pseudarthrobacter sp.]|nr:siderophore interacting protein [Pseudarthrobacter sp.]